MKKLLTFLTLLTLFFGVGWAEESLFYKLDGTITGGNSGYATVSDITQGSMTWKVTGNTTTNPWRIGGKEISQEDRPVYSTTAMGNAISKVSVELGTGNITIVQVQLIVASDAQFNNSIQTQSKTASFNSTIEFTPAEGEWPNGAYYKLNFLVTNTGKSNKYLELKAVNFYKKEGGSTTETCATPTFSPATGTYYEPQSVTLSCTTPGSTIYYTTDGSDPTTSSTEYTSTITVSENTTIKAIATADGMDPSPVASATYTIKVPETVTPTYEQSLINDFGKFYYIDKTNPTTTAVWKSNNYGAVASGRISGTNSNTESWLYSPYIDLTNATNPELSFSHAGNFFQTDMQTDAQVKVRVLNGTEWSEWSDLAISTWPNGTSWDFVDNTTSLSTYAGKKIQIAFKYTSSTDRAGSWEIKNFKIENVDASAPSYYLVGSFNMDGNNWVQQDVNYKFNKTGDNSYSLSAGNLPDDVEFKIIKVDGGTTTWYGGSVNNSQPYAIKSDWHTNIPLKENPNYGESIQNFKMSVGGISNFTLNTSDMTFSVEKTTPQFYFKSSADWTIKNAMTATADGWTITVDCAAGTNFGFNDEWTWYGRDNYWITNSTLGIEIDLSNDGKFYIENAGTYTFTVNSDKTKLVVTKLAEGDKYELITSTDDLEANHEYLVVGKTSTATYVMSKTLDGGRATRISVTPDGNGRISATDAMAIITLGGNSTDGWSLSTSEGYVASGGNGKMQFSSSAVTASIGFGAGDDTEAALIDFSNNTSYPRLKHNTSSQWFACYATNSGTANVYLYKKLSASNKSAAPVITPEGGNVVGYSQEVEITQANGGIIYYTTDGTTPTEASNQYNGAFFTPTVAQLGDEVTVTAVAKEDGKELSNPVSVTYKFVSPVKPTFTPAAGTYTVAQNVSMATTTEGADVYYTTNSELTYDQIVAQGTKFTEPINVSEETTYYAVAAYYDTHAERYAISSITQAKYKFAEVESVDLPYSHPFTGGTGFGEFTTLDVNNPDEITVWTVSDDFGAKGTSYINGTNYAATSWLLSPYINLSNANEPVFTFDHQINKHFSNPSTQATVWIRTYGGEWTPLETSLPTSSSGINGWPKYDEEYDLSAYNGQIVQIGFKYYNPTAGTGAGTWEIQNFKVVDLNQPAIEVNNIAEFMDNTIVPEGSKAKLLNPVVVLYHYQQYHNDTEGDYVNDYIWVKDESGYAIIYGKYLDVNYTNGDVIPAGFTATKFYYNVGRFYQMYYPEGLQPATEKALADPEAVTLSILNSNKDNYNGHYVTIPKMRIKFSSGELVPYQYNFTTEESYGGQRNFEIGDATLSISANNKSIIGYNNFDNPWLETLDYPEYENTTSDYGDYNITGIFERYNGVWEFMPIIITPWEDAKLTLHDLCLTGVEGQTYTISNPLQVVYVDTDRKSVWVKDDNGQSIWSTSPEAPNAENFAIEYASNTRSEQAYYDQSNWCELKFASEDDIPLSFVQNQKPIIKGGMITGKFTNKMNPTLEELVIGENPILTESSSYDNNYYMAANFNGPQLGYFFMNPKPQEYADVVWAIYDSSNQTMIMTNNSNKNPEGFEGSFKVNMSMNVNPSLQLVDGTQTGKGYEHFKAIIRLASTATSNAPMLKDRMPANTEYVVYPLDITQNLPTGITDVNGKAVKSVKYVNVAGMVSDKPFSGVNIVVTEYTDGSRSTTKMLRK